MKGKMKHHMGHHMKKEGGRVGMKAAGNPDVFKEAEGEEDYAKGDERKHGGKVKRAAGGKVLGLMTGGAVKARADRPARKSGGRVGSDRSPLSSAHSSGAAESMPKTQVGPASD